MNPRSRAPATNAARRCPAEYQAFLRPVHGKSAQRESNPHFCHGKAAGYRYIMGAPECAGLSKTKSTGRDSNPRRRMTTAAQWCPVRHPRRWTTSAFPTERRWPALPRLLNRFFSAFHVESGNGPDFVLTARGVSHWRPRLFCIAPRFHIDITLACSANRLCRWHRLCSSRRLSRYRSDWTGVAPYPRPA